MFVKESIEVLIENLNSEVGLLREFMGETSGTGEVDTGLLKSLVGLRDGIDGICTLAMGEFVAGGSWAKDNYLSGRTAVVHETGLSRRSVDADLSAAKVLRRYPRFMDGLASGKINSDHVKVLAPLMGDNYVEFFDGDNTMLFDVACTLPASQFLNVVRHWKNMVDAVRRDDTDEQVAFESRKLFFDELADGQYFIHGQFDAIGGMIIKKALEQVTQKLWNQAQTSSHHEYSPSQMRADALVELSQNFVADKTQSTPALSADIVIDVVDIVPGSTTADFLKRMIEKQAPMVSTHTKNQLKQILCDCELSVPIKLETGQYDLGRKVRTAPVYLKKQLVLETGTCSIKGCVTPAKWCDAHHVKHWVDGGKTSLDNLVLLCRRHHTITHQNNKRYASLSPPP